MARCVPVCLVDYSLLLSWGSALSESGTWESQNDHLFGAVRLEGYVKARISIIYIWGTADLCWFRLVGGESLFWISVGFSVCSDHHLGPYVCVCFLRHLFSLRFVYLTFSRYGGPLQSTQFSLSRGGIDRNSHQRNSHTLDSAAYLSLRQE